MKARLWLLTAVLALIPSFAFAGWDMFFQVESGRQPGMLTVINQTPQDCTLIINPNNAHHVYVVPGVMEGGVHIPPGAAVGVDCTPGAWTVVGDDPRGVRLEVHEGAETILTLLSFNNRGRMGVLALVEDGGRRRSQTLFSTLSQGQRPQPFIGGGAQPGYGQPVPVIGGGAQPEYAQPVPVVGGGAQPGESLGESMGEALMEGLIEGLGGGNSSQPGRHQGYHNR